MSEKQKDKFSWKEDDIVWIKTPKEGEQTEDLATDGRDYAKEYRTFQGTPEQIERRSQRNQARRKMIAAGRASKGDGKDVHHKSHDTSDNSDENLRVISESKNRAMNKKRPKE